MGNFRSESAEAVSARITPQNPIIDVADVRKSYAKTLVLKGITLEVGKGEVVVICGPSGSGKSTFLHCLNGLEPIDSGTIRINGEIIKSSKFGRLSAKVGTVFQSFNLFPHLTILQNLTLAPKKVLGKSHHNAQEYAEKMLERVGILDKINAFPESLSGGQQQRVAIARALCFPKHFLPCSKA